MSEGRSKRSERIVMVVPSFPKLSETFIVNKFVGLIGEGWDVHVLSDRTNWDEALYFPQLTAVGDYRNRVHTVHPTASRLRAAGAYPSAVLTTALHAPRAMRTYVRQAWRRLRLGVVRTFYLDSRLIALKPDLVHFEFGTLAVRHDHIKDLIDCKIVVSFRGFDLNFSGLEQPNYYGGVWRAADGFHFLGSDLMRRARTRGCPSDKPYALIPPAVDARLFDPVDGIHLRSPESFGRPLRILSVGRIEWKKGYEYALQAVRDLITRGVQCDYRIIGDGIHAEAIAFARHQLGLADAVHLLGAQPPERVREEMKHADVFLHAAVSEGFCNAVLEAQAMRLPVVTSDADGLAENVVDGETGFVVPRRNAELLADRLYTIAVNPDLRLRMGDAGRRRVASSFGLKDQAQSFSSFYRTILGREKNSVGSAPAVPNLETIHA